MLQGVAVCCGVILCDVVRYSWLQYVIGWFSLLKCVAVCCCANNVLQRVAVSCGVLQYFTACFGDGQGSKCLCV